MNNLLKSAALILIANSSLLLAAQTLSLHFDDPAKLESLRTSAPLSFCTDKKVAGLGSLAIECLLDGNSFKIDIPKDSYEGCVTFWLFDPLFSGESKFRVGFGVNCTGLKDDRPAWDYFSLDQGRESQYWYLHGKDGHSGGVSTGIVRHPGWTRFDVVNPEGKEPQHFLIYIDGRKAGKTLDKYTAFSAVTFKPFWGIGTIRLDEFSFNPDPDSVRPNVIQSIVAGNEAGGIELQADAKVPFQLRLDRKGTTEKRGNLSVHLLDGSEQELFCKEIPINWEELTTNDVYSDLPSPPHSGLYWLIVKYNDETLFIPDTCRKRINIQFHSKQFGRGKNAVLPLAEAWDWLPAGKKSSASRSSTASIPVPSAPPGDWSGARRMKGVWYDYSSICRHLDYEAGWYHRKINIPKSWSGRTITIRVDDPQSIATVFINRQRAGEILWPGGQLDITPLVKAGHDVDLSILVRAEVYVGYNKVLREIIGDAYRPHPATLPMRGLRGPVSLVSKSQKSRIADVAIQTKVERNKDDELILSFDLENLVPKTHYTLQPEVSGAGKSELAIPPKIFVASNTEEQFRFVVHWDAPVLWDINAPFLYDLNAKLTAENGQVLDVMAPERFGFRDIRCEGRYVTLNDRRINLFHPGVVFNFSNYGFAQYLRELNLNFVSGQHLKYVTKPGEGRSSPEAHVDFCDNAGIGMFISLAYAPFTKTLATFNKENDPRFWKVFEDISRYTIRKFRNHPSVFFWDGPGGGNRFQLGAMYNPYLQDGIWIRNVAQNQLLQRLYKAGRREQTIIRREDSTRAIIAQDSGNFNDTCHITQYAGFMPMQEMIEMNRYWIENGVKPLFYSEQAAPYQANWTNQPRGGGHGEKKLIPYEAEYCAITKGDEAFVRTPLDNKVLKKYEELSEGRFERAYNLKAKDERQKALASYTNTNGPHFPTLALFGQKNPNLRNIVWEERMREQFLNWRADGIGLLCASYNSIGNHMSSVYKKYFAPVTAFIAGPPANRYDKTHIFLPGETMRRGIIILNNSRNARKVRCEWKLELAGKHSTSGSETVTVGAGGMRHIPITARISAKMDCDGAFSMQLLSAGHFFSGIRNKMICEDQVALNVIAPRTGGGSGRIALIDPEGDSAVALQEAGITFQKVHFTTDLTSYDTIIFGRRSFLYELECIPEGMDLNELTQAGKRVVILEQAEETLRKRFKFRTEYLSSRDVYGRSFGGILLHGLPDECLKSWRGASTLTNGYQVARQHLAPRSNEGNGGRWFYLWNDGTEHTRPMKWGNHHSVATVVIIKPDSGNFRTLIDCGFALNYAAAWELENGNGRIVFSQLDISGRTQAEPAAKRYLANLIKYTEKASVPCWREAIYLGGAKGKALLECLRVPFAEIQKPEQADANRHVLVLGDASIDELQEWKTALIHFAQSGGTVFSLPKNDKELTAGWTPVKIQVESKEVNSSYIGKNQDPLLAGIGNSDFYWKGNMDVYAMHSVEDADLLLNSGILARVPQGKGEWLFCQFEPSMFRRNKDYFWLKDSERYTERLLRTLLANLNVRMEAPYLLRQPGSKTEMLVTVDLTENWLCCPGTGVEPNITTVSSKNIWKNFNIPGDIESRFPERNAERGSFWYRRQLDLDEIPEECTGARLILGAVKGVDYVLINGERIGHTSRETNPNDLSTATRNYSIPLNLLREGENEIAIFTVFDSKASLSPGDGNITPPVYLELFTESSTATDVAPIDLSGLWQGHAVEKKIESPSKNSSGWHAIKVPGAFEDQKTEWGGHDGYFWYEHQFVLTNAIARGAQPVLVIGAIDDEDDTYINGTLIGHTGTDTNPQDYWHAERRYQIPTGLLKPGQNRISILVNDLRGSGGITKSPCTLYLDDPVRANARKLAESPYLHQVNKSDDPYFYRGW